MAEHRTQQARRYFARLLDREEERWRGEQRRAERALRDRASTRSERQAAKLLVDRALVEIEAIVQHRTWLEQAMVTSRPSAQRPKPLERGSRVSFQIGGSVVTGVVIDDLGPIGPESVRLLRVRASVDGCNLECDVREDRLARHR